MRSANPIATARSRGLQVCRSVLACENGATSIEYALICTLIFLVIVAGVQGVANNTSNMHNKIRNSLT